MFETHCITLLHDQRRLNHVKQQAALWQNPSFNIRAAIDGRREEVHAFADCPNGWSQEEARAKATFIGLPEEAMHDPSKACTKSHVLLAKEWLDRVESGEARAHDFILVLEDDFVWGNLEGFEGFLTQFKNLRSPFDVVLVGYRGGEKRHYKADFHRFKYNGLSRISRDPISAAKWRLEAQRWPGRVIAKKSLQSAGQHWGTHGYLMNAKAANAIVHVGSSLAYPADYMIRMIQAFGLAKVGITTTKWIITNEDLGSNLRSQERFDKITKSYPTQ